MTFLAFLSSPSEYHPKSLQCSLEGPVICLPASALISSLLPPPHLLRTHWPPMLFLKHSRHIPLREFLCAIFLDYSPPGRSLALSLTSSALDSALTFSIRCPPPHYLMHNLLFLIFLPLFSFSFFSIALFTLSHLYISLIFMFIGYCPHYGLDPQCPLKAHVLSAAMFGGGAFRK